MNKNKLTVLAVASLMILAGCDSKEQQHREAARKANEEWAQNAKDYKVDEYGKGRVLFPSEERKK